MTAPVEVPSAVRGVPAASQTVPVRTVARSGWRRGELASFLRPLFAQLWARHDMAPPGPCGTVFWYSEVGDCATRSTSLDLTDRPGNRLVVDTPLDGASRDRLARLRAHPELALAPHEH